MSKSSEPRSASSQCADEERRGCGTDVPEPSTVRFILPSPFTLSPYPFFLLPPRRREGLARELAVHHRGVVDEGGDDTSGLLHVVGEDAVEVVLIRVPGARLVLDLVLQEVYAVEAGGVEGEEVRAFGVRDRDGRG